MFYTQVVRQKGIPFELRLHKKPLSLSDMTQEELERELEKGVADIKAGRYYTAEEVNRKLAEDLGI